MEKNKSEVTTVEIITGGRQSGKTTALMTAAFENSGYGPVVIEIKNDAHRKFVRRQLARCIGKGGHRINHLPSVKERREAMAMYFDGTAPDYDEEVIAQLLEYANIAVVADHIAYFKERGGVVKSTSLMVDDCRDMKDLVALSKNPTNSEFRRIVGVFSDPADDGVYEGLDLPDGFVKNPMLDMMQ